MAENLTGTQGHETELINVQDLKATIQKFKTDKVDVQAKTYAQLKALRDSGELETGRLYRITDYVTTVGSQITNARSAGHRFDLVVLATSSNTIAAAAQAVKHEYPSDYIPADTSAPDYQEKYDEVHYFDNVPMERWKIDYCLDNDTSKFNWACNADYTFINITSDPAPYNEHLLRYAAGDAEGADYPYCWGDSYFHVYTASETPAVGDTAYGASDGTGNAYTLSVVREVVGKGVICHMVDDLFNDLLFDFKNIQFKRYETGDKSELVVDSTFLTDDFDGTATKMAMAVNVDMLGDGMNNDNYACYYGWYYATGVVIGSSLSGSFVGYDLVTPKTIDATAMYRPMCSRKTAKKIFCKVVAEKWFYPFHIKGDTENGRDLSIIPYVYGSSLATKNIIKASTYSNKARVLQNAVWLIYSNGLVGSNTLNMVRESTFGNMYAFSSAYDISYVMINNATNVTIDIAGNAAIYNITHSDIKFFSYSFSSDIYETIVDRMTNCIVRKIYGSIVCGACYRVIIGNDCRDVKLQSCDTIVFGDNFTNSELFCVKNFLLGSSFLSPHGYVKGFKVENADYVKLLCAETTSAAVPLQNVKICAGVSGTSAAWKTITVPVAGQEYEIEYKATDSQTIFV